jgi:hypothetical protein
MDRFLEKCGDIEDQTLVYGFGSREFEMVHALISDLYPQTIEYDPSTISISQIPLYMWSQEIQLYNSANQPILANPEVVSLYSTSTTINFPVNLMDPNDSYQWELSVIADDYYKDFTGTRYSSSGPTQELAYIDWQPGIIEDPAITFSNRTKESFSVGWFSANATSYRVDIKRNSTGVSLPGYPVTTTDTSDVLSVLTINALYNVSVTALGGTAIPPKESIGVIIALFPEAYLISVDPTPKIEPGPPLYFSIVFLSYPQNIESLYILTNLLFEGS